MLKSLFMTVSVLLLAASQVAGQHPEGEARFSAKRMELLRLWRLVDELRVDEAQAEKLFPLWSRQHRQRRELQVERKALTEELRDLLDSDDVEEGALEKHIAQIRDLDRKRGALETATNDELTKLLSTRQQARLLLFGQQFRGDLKEIIQGFRGRSSGRRGAPAGRGERRLPPWAE
jgi:Spy/CpxP family protein refolding chaperone